jgi:hypothetical protein
VTRPSAPKLQPRLVKIPWRQRFVYILWALAFLAIGAALLSYNLGLWPAGVGARVLAYWPVLLIALGVLILLTGRAALGFDLPTFAIERGEHVSARLGVPSGLSDVRVSAFAGASQLAVGKFPNQGGPRLNVEDGQAHLILDRRAAAPFLLGEGEWSVALAKGLPWTIEAHSTLGDFRLDLRDLTVPSLHLRSWAGHVDLTLPVAGPAEFEIRLTLGDLTVRVPEGAAMRIRLKAGPLTRVQIANPRLAQSAPNEWSTPDLPAAAQPLTLTVELTTGDVFLA